MKNIPFVKNHEDNKHCVNAVFRMVHQYFFGTDLSFEEIDKLTKAIPGKATWTFIGEMEFAKKGLKVTNIEKVDYKKLYEKGVDYLKTIVGEETANYYLTKTNIASVVKYIPEYLKYVHHKTRKATIKDIINLLNGGALVGAEVNHRVLNNQPGFGLHFVLLYDFDGKNIIFHDPGPPIIKSRKISIEDFDKCFNFKGADCGISVFEKLDYKL
jgi:hypothetical protein